MTIDELIERLEEYRDNLGGDAEVRLMTQQHWPFENEITGLASGEGQRHQRPDHRPLYDRERALASTPAPIRRIMLSSFYLSASSSSSLPAMSRRTRAPRAATT